MSALVRRSTSFGFARLAWLSLTILGATPLVAPAARAADIVVEHARGKTTVHAPPQRTVLFDIGALDTLHALGASVVGVPGSNLPDYLATYRDRRYAKVGTLFEPDYEAVNAAEPDLIIVGPRSAAKYADLSRLAPTVDLTVPADRFVSGTRAQVELLGRLYGKEAEAAALTARLDAAIGRVKAVASKSGTVLLVMVNGGKLTAFGAGSRFGWLYDELGLKPVARSAAASAHGEVLSFEYILKTDPDWLLVLDRDAATGHAGMAARAVMDNEIIAATRAARSGRIVYLDPVRWYIVGNGGDALPTMVETLASALEAKQGQ